MLQFIDSNFAEHSIHIANLNNVVSRDAGDKFVLAFHMVGGHMVPVTVDRATAQRIFEDLKEVK
ncbi:MULTISPECIES: hypothetical protein [Acinetobacter]|uniref:hypothetical protein n=1 Tax=Acinetobacter TaxID=469 RepID=UPI0015D2BE15|nr:MULTISPECIES: hypothetical protein [Acinetobacter]MDM1274046.1 hypothetical protein [Acinetobacter indicus]